MARRLPPPGRRGEIVYQVYLRSFADGTGDGVGDLKGLLGRLDHIADLGVDIVWITPIYPSPMADFGYDVADYTGVDPLFGTLADIDAVIARAHALGLKVMLDMVVSHSSDQHAWFQESRRDRTNPKAEWYVWADPKPNGAPPNSWAAVFGGSAWEWSPERRQYYLHNFLVSQPDLNFHNPEVQDAVLAAFRFWLERGVDGFRLDVVNFYAHDQTLRDNPPTPADRVLKVTTRANPYGWQEHIRDINQPETLAFCERLRALCDGYDAILMGELVTDHQPAKLARAYTAGETRLHMVYAFDLFAAAMTPADIRGVVERVTGALGRSGWVAWAMSNHDVPRVVSRWGFDDVADQATPALIALLTALPGSACLYQGEELGLVEADVPFEALQDPYGKRFWPTYKGRDGCRTPMPWDGARPGAGFTDDAAKPWLPVEPRHRAAAVSAQAGRAGSTLERVKAVLAFRRRHPPLATGAFALLEAGEHLIAFDRGSGRNKIRVIVNLTRAPRPVPPTLLEGWTPLDGHGLPGLHAPGAPLPPFGVVYASKRLGS